MPNQEKNPLFHFLYTTLPFVFEIGQTIISFHFVQMVCISKPKVLLCKIYDFTCSLLLALYTDIHENTNKT